MEIYNDFEVPGKLTVNRDPYQAAIDDMMCSVFHDPTVVRAVAGKLGFEYLEEHTGGFPDTVSGIIHGTLNRVVLPMVAEEFMVIKKVADPHPPKQLRIVMMYDTGSALTYLTKEVLEALGFEDVGVVDPNHPTRVSFYTVRLNGRIMQVGLCPKERCEHVCLLGQDYLMEYGIVSEINHRNRKVTLKAFPE
eukprot:gene31239-biopygen6112